MPLHSDYFGPLLDKMIAADSSDLIINAGQRPRISIVTPDGIDVKPLDGVPAYPDLLYPALDSLKEGRDVTSGEYVHADRLFVWYESTNIVTFRYVPKQPEVDSEAFAFTLFNPLLEKLTEAGHSELMVRAAQRPYFGFPSPDGLQVKPVENSVPISPEVLIPALESLQNRTGSDTGSYRHDDNRFRWNVSGDTIVFRRIPNPEDLNSEDFAKNLKAALAESKLILLPGTTSESQESGK